MWQIFDVEIIASEGLAQSSGTTVRATMTSCCQTHPHILHHFGLGTGSFFGIVFNRDQTLKAMLQVNPHCWLLGT